MTLRHKSATPALRVCASATALALLAACGDDSQHSANGNAATVLASTAAATTPSYSANIQRTSHGIPHISAANEGSLGFGVAYAFAQDNVCQLADEIVTVNGQRSAFFGADASAGDRMQSNLQTDYFYRLVNTPAALESAWGKYPAEMRALVEGYVAGYNHFLATTGVAKLPVECRNAPWVRKLEAYDMVRLLRRYAVEAGAGQFIGEIVGATPPGSAPTASQKVAPANVPVTAAANPMNPAYWTALRHRTGSNAVALGRSATSNGQGMLLSNPHFPWHGSLRFYQLHLTIPGKLDAMGASLGGLPLVNIGFNQHLAWGHTMNTSAHFTAFMLQLDPADPTRFIVDGKSQPMIKKTISLQVKGADGVLRTQSRDFYSSSQFGMLAVLPGTLDWSTQYAYTLRDPNLDNHRMLEQWSAINRATTLDELKASVNRIVGLPWATTLAADKAGNTLFMDVTVVPNVSKAKQSQCVPEPFQPLAAQGLFVLSGASSACNWDLDPAAPQPGIFAGASLPQLARSDFVQNSNDSAWMSNPYAPLTGFPAIVSIEGRELSGRTRLGISQVQRRLAGADSGGGNRMSFDQLQLMALNNRSYYADLMKDELAQWCTDGATGTAADLTAACQQLLAWDRSAGLHARIGLPYFTGMWERVKGSPKLWDIPFNPLDPVNTPRALNITNPNVTAALRTALAASVDEAKAQGWTGATTWGQMQGTMRGDKWIPIHGGAGELGIYNAVDSVPVAPGVREVLYGTSYIQAVTFIGKEPVARALLSYSQSSNPASPYYADQTERFSKKSWVTLPFTQAQIEADPARTKMTVSNQALVQ